MTTTRFPQNKGCVLAKRTTVIVTLVVEGDPNEAVNSTWDHLKRWFNEHEREEKLGSTGALSWYSVAVTPERVDVFRPPVESEVHG